MEPVHEGVLQEVRAVLVGSLVLSLAAGAHVLGGGDLPATSMLLLLAALVLVVSRLGVRGRSRLRTLVPAMAVGQTVLHALFAALAVPAAGGAAAPAAGGHAHGAVVLAALPAGGGAADPLAAVADQLSPVMLLAHAAATLVTAGAVVVADRAWASAVAWSTRLLPLLLVLLRGPLAGPAPRAVATPVLRRLGPSAVAVAALPHRGPPRVVPAA